MSDVSCDVLVVGSSLGGVAAALSAARSGKQTILLTGSAWFGGQMTSQGVCTPDENQYVESTGSTRSYRDFRQRTRQYYEDNYPLSAYGNSRVSQVGHLNLGESWVSDGYSVEPKVGSNLLKQMLEEVGVQVISGARVDAVTLSDDGNSVVGLTATASDGSSLSVRFSFVLDATDLGELLPMANVEHIVGAESRADTGEPDAPTDGPHSEWLQPFTFPIALEKRPGTEHHVIAKPDGYEAIRDAQNFTLIDGNINGMFAARPLPNRGGTGLIFWTYRRVVEAALFKPGAGPYIGDVATINVGSNDYLGGVIPSGDPAADAAAINAARQVSRCYTYWLQTECPRDAGDGSGKGYPNLRPVTEFWDTPDAIAPEPYIREGRRIRALTTIVEQDVVSEDSSGGDWQMGARGRLLPDSCGIGHYGIDIHATSVGQTQVWLDTKPYQIPLGALIPVRVTNFLPACKNIGVTHLTNGAYRLHPIEWNVGEVAGAFAGFCMEQNKTPQAIAADPALVQSFQKILLDRGVRLFWWTDISDSDPAFAATQLLGVQGVFTGAADSLDFNPHGPVTDAEKEDLLASVAPARVTWPTGPVTRAQAAVLLTA